MSMDARRFVMAGVILMATASVVTLAQAGGAGEARPWWGWVLLGRTHPFIVHFPIGLLLAGAAVELVRWLRGRPIPSDVGRFCLVAGLLGGALAVWLGTLNASHQSITGESAAILERHQAAGWAVLAVGALAWLTGRLTATTGRVGARGLYVASTVAMAGLVAATGHFGGQLVYGSTYVTSVLPWNQVEPTAAVAPPASSATLETPPSPAPVSAPSGGAEATEPSAEVPTTDGPDDGRAPIDGERPASVVAERDAVSPGTRAAAPEPSSGRRAEAVDSPRVPAAEPPAASAATPATAPSTRAGDPSASDGSGPRPAAAPAPAQAPAQAAAVPGPSVARVSFTRDVAPLIRATCVECHGPDKVKARLRMDSVAALRAGGKSGPLFEPGDPERSLMLRRVQGLDGEDQMPLDADPLTPEQIELLRRWIAEGAHFDAPASDDAEPGR